MCNFCSLTIVFFFDLLHVPFCHFSMFDILHFHPPVLKCLYNLQPIASYCSQMYLQSTFVFVCMW